MADEFVCDTPEVRAFIGQVRDVMATTHATGERLAAIRPHFSRMLADPAWLPDEFRQTVAEGGMGKGVASWLLYRDADGTLSLSALVLAPGVATPVHDHLAWGLVGLYAGRQDEEVFESDTHAASPASHAHLRLAQRNHLEPGSFYELLPPAGDIHRVITTSAEPSISLHLLGNDIGCVMRHRFEPDTGEVAPFRSGYTNRDCDAEDAGVPQADGAP